MPRAPWVRRRRTTDSPRPAGRRWARRLRRSGSLARQMLLVRVGRRRLPAAVTTLSAPGEVDAAPTGHSRLILPADRDPLVVAPVSPAVPGAGTSRTPGNAPTAPSPAVPGTGSTVDVVRADALPAGDQWPGAAEPDQPPRTIALLPGARTTARRVRFVIANGCTVSSLLLGITAILLSLHSEVRLAAVCLVGCVIFDGLDGALARKLGVTSPFGSQMDSMADMCSFGVAAPVMIYASVQRSAPPVALGAACALVAACAAIRLARFNVSPKDGRFFCGVPTTMAAAVLGLATLIGLRLPGTVAVAAIVVLALAMVSSFPYAKLARIVRLPRWVWLAPIAGAFVDYRITFAALVGIYLISGPLIWLRVGPHRATRATAGQTTPATRLNDLD